MIETPPAEYKRFVIEAAVPAGEMLSLHYGGHVFGGIVRCQLDPNGVEAALRPGTEVFVWYHDTDTGQPGQVAHIIIRHPSEDGWAEIYADGV